MSLIIAKFDSWIQRALRNRQQRHSSGRRSHAGRVFFRKREGCGTHSLDTIPKHLGKFAGKKNTVVYCRSGNRGGQAKRILEQSGIRNVTDGGTWQNLQQLLSN